MAIQISAKLPKKAVYDASKFLQRLLGPVAEASDLLTDKIRIIRFENAIKTIKRAEEITENEGIKIKQLPLNFLVPFLEQASLQEDDQLTDIWARLLSNAATEYNPIYAVIKDTLSRLTSKEVHLLNQICDIKDFDPKFENCDGNADIWLDWHHESIRDMHVQYARMFDKAWTDSYYNKKQDKYFKETGEYMMIPFEWHVSSDHPALIKGGSILHSEYRSSLHILQNLNIFEMQSFCETLAPSGSKMLAKLKLEQKQFPGLTYPPRTFKAKWLQITSYGLEVFLKCTQTNSKKSVQKSKQGGQ